MAGASAGGTTYRVDYQSRSGSNRPSNLDSDSPAWKRANVLNKVLRQHWKREASAIDDARKLFVNASSQKRTKLLKQYSHLLYDPGKKRKKSCVAPISHATNTDGNNGTNKRETKLPPISKSQGLVQQEVPQASADDDGHKVADDGEEKVVSCPRVHFRRPTNNGVAEPPHLLPAVDEKKSSSRLDRMRRASILLDQADILEVQEVITLSPATVARSISNQLSVVNDE